MAGRPCTICISSEKSRVASELIGSGATDHAIADKLGVGRMAVSRHRQNHIVAPARALVEAAGKAQDARQQREEALAAAEAGDPSGFVALASIVADLRRVQDRLERTAAAAEMDGQRVAVSALSSQQLRAAEVRAKIGGVGGFALQKASAALGQQFVLNISFSGERAETLSFTPVLNGPLTDDG